MATTLYRQEPACYWYFVRARGLPNDDNLYTGHNILLIQKMSSVQCTTNPL